MEMGVARVWLEGKLMSDWAETEFKPQNVMMLPLFGGTPDLQRPQLSKLQKMGVAGRGSD